MVRSSETPAFWSVDCSFRKKFRVMKVSLERCFGVSLPLPLFPVPPPERMLRFKEFCSAPMERKAHLWDVHLQKLGKRSRFSIWMSLFLFRKILPSNAPDLEEFMDKISVPSPEPDPLFIEYVQKEIPFLFRKGWDKGYSRQTELAVASTSACSERSRSKGGCRMLWLSIYHDEARSEFCDFLRGKMDNSWAVPNVPARLSAVPTAGKVRLLSVTSARTQLLSPLHKTMYNHISKQSWLLRGDAKARSFKDFKRVPGEVFVSGDYESATDCLNQNVQKEILRLILQQCEHVPNVLRQEAMQTLSMKLSLKRKDGSERIEEVRTGQMMGSQLSFPLLCVVNYLAFRFATMDKKIPVKINGDDIVFRSKPSVAERWMNSVSHAGLKLSRGKTLVDCSVFTLNSTLFTASQFSVKSLPFIRAKALFGTDEGYTSLTGRFRSFAPGFGQTRAFRLRSVFLRQNVGYITKSRRSLNRGLGMHVPLELLKLSRMWGREVDYLSLPKEKKPPPSKSMWEMQPEGYHIEHKEEKNTYSKEEQRELVDAVVSAAWKIPDAKMDSYEDMYDGGINRPAMNYRRGARLMGTQYGCLKKVVEVHRFKVYSDYLSTMKRTYPVWVKDKESNSPPSTFDEGEIQLPVPPIDLGPSTVWEVADRTEILDVCSFGGEELIIDDVITEQTLKRLSSRNKLKVFTNGIGIGPPTCF